MYQRCFNAVSTSDTEVVSTLCNVEDLTSDFALFSTSDKLYFKVGPRWSEVEMLAGLVVKIYSMVALRICVLAIVYAWDTILKTRKVPIFLMLWSTLFHLIIAEGKN